MEISHLTHVYAWAKHTGSIYEWVLHRDKHDLLYAKSKVKYRNDDPWKIREVGRIIKVDGGYSFTIHTNKLGYTVAEYTSTETYKSKKQALEAAFIQLFNYTV